MLFYDDRLLFVRVNGGKEPVKKSILESAVIMGVSASLAAAGLPHSVIHIVKARDEKKKRKQIGDLQIQNIMVEDKEDSSAKLNQRDMFLRMDPLNFEIQFENIQKIQLKKFGSWERKVRSSLYESDGVLILHLGSELERFEIIDKRGYGECARIAKIHFPSKFFSQS